MENSIPRFLRYLKIERNCSDLTIKSYREDLELLHEYLTDSLGGSPSPDQLTPLDLRTYVAALHEAGYAKSSVARRLASLRSYFRFAMREGLCDSNPAKPLRNPRREKKLPHFLSGREIGKLLAAPAKSEPLGLRDRAILETLSTSKTDWFAFAVRANGNDCRLWEVTPAERSRLGLGKERQQRDYLKKKPGQCFSISSASDLRHDRSRECSRNT